jgi:drug/metabolite transporter (DMT)-like permease
MKSHAAKGLIFALLGFGLLSLGDAVIKSIAGAWPGTAVGALRYAVGAGGLGVILFLKEGRAGFVMPKPWVQIGRGLTVAFASACFFMGLFLMPLAEATAITFTSPMLTGLIAAVFLKERLARVAWAATVVAFVGVLIVLRPNIVDLGLAALLPLGSAVGMAMLMTLNRMTAGAASVLTMQFLISIIATPFLIGFAVAGHYSGLPSLAVGIPDWTIVARCALVAVTASTAHTLVYLATTRASAASIAPMIYVQLLLALVIGYFAFGDAPDLTAIGGAALIVGSGLFLWWAQKDARLAGTFGKDG